MNCKYTYGLPYECKSSSKAERTNKRLNQSLRLVLEGKDPKKWDRYLDYVCSALNSLKNRKTGYSANILLYGHDTPITLLLDNGDMTDVFDPEDPNPYNRKAYEHHQAYKDIIRKVSRNLRCNYEHADMCFNRNIRNTPFKAGDMCFVMIRCKNHKFSPRWFGPVPVVKVINDHVYVVKLLDSEEVINISKLKKYTVNKYSPPLAPVAKDGPSAMTDKPITKVTAPPRCTGVSITVNESTENIDDSPPDDTSALTTEVNIQESQLGPSNPNTAPDEPDPSNPIYTPEEQPADQSEQQPSVVHERPIRARKRTQPLQVNPDRKSYRD